MTVNPLRHESPAAQPGLGKHDWEMVAAFALILDKEKSSHEKCMLEPVALSLKEYGMEEPLLREICAEVERVGEELRECCPDGSLECINVRVQVALKSLAQRAQRGVGEWRYFVIKQIASSESDNLEAMEHPRCFIDLHVYRGG